MDLYSDSAYLVNAYLLFLLTLVVRETAYANDVRMYAPFGLAAVAAEATGLFPRSLTHGGGGKELCLSHGSGHVRRCDKAGMGHTPGFTKIQLSHAFTRFPQSYQYILPVKAALVNKK